MKTTRRMFAAEIAGLGGLAIARLAWPPGLRAGTAPDGDWIAGMKWMNDPAAVAVADGRISVKAKPKTDFWRKTFYGYVTDNGHFFHRQVSGDFVFEARVAGAYRDLYDQAGLMIRADAENWMKCGTEMVDGMRHASVVFTREFSDWSTMDDLSQKEPVWWRAVRKKDSIETLCSLDGEKFQSVRQGYMAPGRPLEVGVMCAAPEGQGFEAVFDRLKLTTG